MLQFQQSWVKDSTSKYIYYSHTHTDRIVGILSPKIYLHYNLTFIIQCQKGARTREAEEQLSHLGLKGRVGVQFNENNVDEIQIWIGSLNRILHIIILKVLT
jgi:hypothetical protein